MPEGPLGRISLAFAPSNGNHVFALIDSQKGSLFESKDLGEKWEKVTDTRLINVRPWYFSVIAVSPADENKLYFGSFNLVTSIDGGLGLDHLPWSSTFDPASVQAIQLDQDLFHALFAVALVVALVILALSYVVRSALLEVLVVLAPLAALCTVLPDTRPYAKRWLRLFMVTVFMQMVQLVVLRVAATTGFVAGDGIAASLYGLATLWIMLKVPGALHSASHMESRANSMGHHVERAMHRAMAPPRRAVRRRAST